MYRATPEGVNHVQFMVLGFHWISLIREAGWCRFGATGPGLQWKFPSARAYFSERNGYHIPFLKIGGFRFFYLKPTKGRLQ